MISTRSLELVIDTVVCLTLAKWETVSGQFGGYLSRGMTSFKVVLAGEIKRLLVYEGVFRQRHMHQTNQYMRGFFESAGGTAVNCVDERPMLDWTHDASS